MRQWRTLAASIVLAGVITGCGAGGEATSEPTTTATPATRTVQGTFVLHDKDAHYKKPVSGEPCEGDGGYSDIAAGTQVILSSDGVTLDTGRLSPGSTTAVHTITVDGFTAYTTECTFRFELDVPDGHRFYTVSIGRRGDQTYTYEELTAPSALSFELGQ